MRTHTTRRLPPWPLLLLAVAAVAPWTPVGGAPADEATADTTDAATTDKVEAPAPAADPEPRIRFEEVAEEAGVRFVHTPRRFVGQEKRQVLEMFTAGGASVAVGDFDADGLDDLFVTDSDLGKRNRLYRNLGDFRFEEVAESAGVAGGNDERSIVADALWFDHDDDGHLDLLVARFGAPLLHRNLGPGEDGRVRFEEISDRAGFDGFGNTIAAITFDAENDGDLDLLFANYFPHKNLLHLEDPYVLPNNLDDADNGGGLTFWRNDPREGGGRVFIDATAEAGFDTTTGWSLDLGHADLDNDGDQDVYVAGDYGTDRLYRNRGDGTFEDVTESAIGFDTRKGMNVDFADYDGNGYLDVYVTNITDEYMKECNMLWHNNGDWTFLDLSRETGTCDTDWGWAAKFADFDNDGWQDLYVVNGLRSASEENYIPVLLEMIITPGVDFSDLHSYPDIGDMTWSGYQESRLFHNLGDGTFREIAADAGVDNDLDGRGIGVADFDNDGLLDFYQSNVEQPSLLYRGRAENAGRWVELQLAGTRSNRDAIGARVTLTAGGLTQMREVDGGNGYASQSSRRLHFGLGSAASVESVEIRWPSGAVEVLEAKEGRSAIPVGALSRVVEGKGLVDPS